MTVSPQQRTFLFDAPEKVVAPKRRNLVIEAGAGTGKTTAIVGEVLKILLDNDELSPERIVLVTFTEKAAGEIADRIYGALSELHESLEKWPRDSPHPVLEVPPELHEKYRKACEKQLGRVDDLRSQTIHSFCQGLLRQFPVEAGVDPQFKIVEGFERSLLYGELYDKWIDEETRQPSSLIPHPSALQEWEFLIAHFGYLFQIRDAIFSLLERRDVFAETGYDLGDLHEVEGDLVEAIEKIKRADLNTVGDEETSRALRYLQRTNAPERGSIDSWIDYLMPVAGALRQIDLPRANPDLRDAIVTLRADKQKGKSIYDRLVSHRAAVALYALTARFIDYMDREKRRLGVLDFDDLLLRTNALLENDDVLERVRRQYDYIFVDEFQDTDRTQARILDKLSRDRSGQYVAGKTIVVGDPKQSIYGFRRADLQTYDETTRKMLDGGAGKRDITDQYRSDPTLLEGINAIFTHLFDEGAPDANVYRPSYRDLRAAKPVPDRDVEVPITFLHAQESEEKRDRFFCEAEAIAEWIKTRNEGDLRRFAILFRRMTQVDDYLETLRRHNIDFVLPPTRLFLDRRAPVDLLAVLRAIAFPFDRGAEISAARTPYFALTDEEVALGILSENPAYAQFRAALDSYRRQSTHLTVSQLIDVLVATTRIESVYDAARDGIRSKLHLEHVRSIAFDFDQKIGGSVRQFVDEIDRRRSDHDDVEPSLIDDSRNAVRILTVHGAKGLEFDTVILPDLSFSSSNREKIRIYTVEEPRSLVMTGGAQSLSAHFRESGGRRLKQIATIRDDAETQRLFYVAVTRARSEVVFVCNTTSAKNTGFFSCLSRSFGLNKDLLPAHFPAEAGRRVETMSAGMRPIQVAFERFAKAPAEAGAPHRLRLNDPQLESQLASGAIVPVLIDAPADVATLSSSEIAIKRAGSRNRRAGILLHRVLERWDGVATIDPLVAQLAAEIAATPDDISRVRRRIASLSSSETFRRILAAQAIGREIPLRFIDESGSMLVKRIDRLIRENGRDVVIDYKSGEPSDSDREQVALYCRAISAITGRACDGLLWYINLDSDSLVTVNN